MSNLNNTYIDAQGNLRERTSLVRGRRISAPDKLSDQTIVEDLDGNKVLARKVETDLQIDDIPNLRSTLDALGATDAAQQLQITENAGNIAAETNNRQIEDGILDGKITTEKNEREAADGILEGGIADVRRIISEEITRATDAEYEISSTMVVKNILPSALVSATIDATASAVSLKTQSKSTTDAQITENTYTLPVASSTQHGVMSKEAYAQLQNLETRTGALEGASRRYPVHLGTSPLTQDQYQAAFEVACGTPGQVPPDGATLVNLDNNHAITYFENANGANEHWIDRGIDTVAVATNLITGIVKGTTQTAGKIFVELDGTMSVNGWDGLVSDVSNHISDNVRHITATERATWNGKQSALSAEQLLAVNSGATAALIGQISTNESNIATHTTQITGLQTGKQNNLTAEQLEACNSGITAAKVSQYDGYATGKQDKLISGTNIKKINGNDILGSGNLTMSMAVDWGNVGGTLANQTDLKNALDAKQGTLSVSPGLKLTGDTLSLDNMIDCGSVDGDDTAAYDCGTI